eukprot:SAG11_NODE_2354_length_3476_cov_1.793012_4_plen_174_part_00
MLFYDVDVDLFHQHRHPLVIFFVFVLYSFLAIIVMLNLLIAIMDASYENISENAGPESLHEKANLIIDIISMMEKEDRTADKFPCWLHMLKPKGQSDEGEGGNPFEDNGVRSITRTLQASTKKEIGALESRINKKFEPIELTLHNVMGQLEKQSAILAEVMAQTERMRKKNKM